MGLKSALSDFLFQKLEDQAPPRLDVGFEPALPARILDADEPHPAGEDLPESASAEGQTFVICYVNGQGVKSTRRITMRALQRTSELRILLLARCAETRKEMHFRADRIQYCMDINGAVFEPPATFLAEIFGLDPVDAGLLASEGYATPDKWPPADSVYSLLRQQLGHDITLMAAMAESDGQISITEADAILAYVRRRADVFGIELDDARVRKVTGFLRRLRPTEDQVRASLDEIGARPAHAQLELITACGDVMHADGEVHVSEMRLLEQIRAELQAG